MTHATSTCTTSMVKTSTTNLTSTQTSTPASSQILDAERFDLWGSRLIEASAGTGKTWTIAALYVRLVLGHGAAHGFIRPLRPSEILVMTFTRAATRELSNRIRERLLDAAQCFRGDKAVDPKDDFLTQIMAAYATPTERNRAAWNLAMAAESMDDAAVHTIDAWCQRMLKEHAFDSGNLFDEELVADEKTMQIEAAHDYWRQSCYPLASDPLSQVLGIWNSVSALVKDMANLQDQDIATAAGFGTLEDVLGQATAARADALSLLKQGWDKRAQNMQDWLDGQMANAKAHWDGRRLSSKNYSAWLNTLINWANGQLEDEIPDLKTGWERFTPEGLMYARKPGAPNIDLPVEFSEFVQLQIDLEQLPEIAVPVRLHAAAQVAQRLLHLKRQDSSFGFADMLHRLDTALKGAKGQSLRERILAQYPVILIDEFQDTSPLQYQIFDQIYRTESNDPLHGLFLIGDPKQSIYGFRGADINSYLQARRATAGRHYMLETNYRSTEALVEVVNHCFEHADKTRHEGAFIYRQDSDNPLPFVQVNAKGRNEQLVSSTGPVPALTLVHDLETCNTDGMRKRFAARCAQQIVTWLNDPKAGFAQKSAAGEGDKLTSLRPADIAILVRTGKEAACVQRELARRAIASVYLSDKESVLQSPEARDLVHWLKAVASPQEIRLVRAGLATRTLGLSLNELGWLASNDEAFDARCEQLRQLRSTWQLQGVLAMLRQTLHQFHLAAKFLAEPGGERSLTNVLHLAELLQNASTMLDGEQALIRWLATQIQEETAQSDEQVVRLESDADLVKVITIHKSKGLEYPVVCLPFSASFREKESKTTTFVNLADAQGQRELKLQFSKEELALADKDRLREDVRLLYVALTRARHALWVGFSAVKVGKSDKCMSHKSAAGYLLGGTEQIDAPDWLPVLEAFADGQAGLVLQTATNNTPCTPLERALDEEPLKDFRAYQADFERDWSIGSFSGFTRNLATLPTTAPSMGTQLSPLQVTRPADDEIEPMDETTVMAPKNTQDQSDDMNWHTFVRGSEAGNFLHDQLEWLATEHFALADNEAALARLTRSSERCGRALQADLVANWLTQVVQTVLPGPNVALAALINVMPEMEFWLPVHQMQAKRMDAHCREHLLPGVDRPALADRQLHGMLMGFADLVFEHQGRYWVLDYKSNHLGDSDAQYDSTALTHAMAEHRYDVQAAIYMLALHRLLQARLGENYQPEQHLGGAVYLFLRGIKGPQNGVCLIPASMPLIDSLNAMLLEEVLS